MDEVADDPAQRWVLTWPGDAPAPDADVPVGAAPVAPLRPPVAPSPSASPSPRMEEELLAAGPDVMPYPAADAERIARFVAHAYDRLGDQIVSEVRALQARFDLDLVSLRTELSSLRRNVDDPSERVQVRELRGAIDELREDVTSLRHVVLEWPELEQVGADITDIRASLRDLGAPVAGERPAGVAAVDEAAIAELRDEIVALRSVVEQQAARDDRPAVEPDRPRLSVTALAPVIDELAALRQEVTALKRRIALRGSPSVTADDLARELKAALAELAEQIAPRG